MTPQRGLAEQEEGAEQAPGQAEILWGRSGVRLGYMVLLKARKEGAAALCHDCMFIFIFFYLTSHSLSPGDVSVQSHMHSQTPSARLGWGVLYPQAPRVLQAGSLAPASSVDSYVAPFPVSVFFLFPLFPLV